MQVKIHWKNKTPNGYLSKHYVVRKDSNGAESYIHCVRILAPMSGGKKPANTIKTFKNYALIEYWEYYTFDTWVNIVNGILKIKEYGRNH